MGLSPRVRGSLEDDLEPVFLEGSIPAGAGEPIQWVEAKHKTWVYPRGCGGARYGHARLFIIEGLSPRVRGSPWP